MSIYENQEDLENELPEPFDQQEAAEQAFDDLTSKQTIARSDEIVRELKQGGALIDYAAEQRIAAVDSLTELGALDFDAPNALQEAKDLQTRISDYWRVCQYVDRTIEAGDREQDALKDV